MPRLHRFTLLVAVTSTLLLAGCRSGRFPQYAASYREFAYVANSGANTVSVLDLVNMQRDRELPISEHPIAIMSNPVRNEVYAVSTGAPNTHGSLAIIDAESNSIAAKLNLGTNPVAVDVDRSGSYAFIANAASNNLSVVDLLARRITSQVGTGEAPGALRVSPDGTSLVVSNTKSNSVSLYTLSLKNGSAPQLRASFPQCPGAGDIAILPDNSKAFIACSAGHQVMVVGLRTPPSQHLSPGSATESDRLIALLDVGHNPAHLALKPDGGEIFVSNHGDNTISEIATGTNDVGGASIVGANPIFGVVSADNTLLWIANEGTGTIGVYSVDDGKLINTVHVGDAPCALAFSADQHLLLSVDRKSGDIAVIRTFDRNLHREAVYGTLFTMLAANKTPVAITVKAFHTKG